MNFCYLAKANVKGSAKYSDIKGTVWFKDVPFGTEVYVSVAGLPDYEPAKNGQPPIGPFGFHLHEKGSCEEGDPEKPFLAAGEHFNPTNQPHGNHAGDFPVLFSNNGVSIMSFFTDRFKVNDIIDKSVIIHENPDDYRSEPSGDAGIRIACGVVKPVKCLILPLSTCPCIFPCDREKKL